MLRKISVLLICIGIIFNNVVLYIMGYKSFIADIHIYTAHLLLGDRIFG